MNQIVSFSGGKDSTAMLLMMIEQGEPIHSVVFFDTGWEFPAVAAHIKLVEQRTGIDVVRLKPKQPFDRYLAEHPVIARYGPKKGEVHRHGYGWPSMMRRWCTGFKVKEIGRYVRTVPDPVQCVGIASGENRSLGQADRPKVAMRYPLVEWGITGGQALRSCLARGYDFGGLYEHFDRLSCFCCPLKNLSELRALRKHYPDLWRRMLDMDARIEPNHGFRGRATVHDLEKRFAGEEKTPLFDKAPGSEWNGEKEGEQGPPMGSE